MRKTLVVLALIISSVLLLQTPAWAPNLYRLKQNGGQTASSSGSGLRVAVVEGRSDCNNLAVTIAFRWGETRRTSADANGRFTVGLTRIPAGHGAVTKDDVSSFACGALAFTGTPSVRLLAFGLSLLVAGVLLLLASRRRGRPLA
jgi:hypothetical protein